MSFLDPILAKLRGTDVAAISFSQEGEEWETHGCVMSLEKDQINLQSPDQFLSQSRVNAWLDSIKALPLVIAIASDEVLTRKVEAKHLPKEELLKLIIPQARPEEFFMQQLENTHGTFVSVIRKNRLNQILEIIPDANPVVGIYLAPLSLVTLAKGLKTQSIDLSGFRFNVERDEVLHINHLGKREGVIALSERESLDQNHVLSYSAGINYLLNTSIPSDFNVKMALEEYGHKRFLSKFGSYVLGTIFLIFLINIFFFFEWSKENEQLLQENSSLLALQGRVEEMEAYLETYKDLLGDGEQSIFTKFSDELGHSVPQAIQLERLIVRPLYLNEKKAIEKEATVWIEGISENAQVYANWIGQVKDLEWVDGIIDNTYRNGKFELRIIIKSDV